MWIFLDDHAALMVIRRQIEKTYRLVVNLGSQPDEARTQRAIDEWLVKASALLEQHAPGVFRNAQDELVKDVALKVIQEIMRQTKKRGDQGVYSPADLKEMRLLNDLRKKLSNLAKTRHNEIVGIKRGRQAGKKDSKPRDKRLDGADCRKQILAAMRAIGRELVGKKTVALKIGCSEPTLRAWLKKIKEDLGEDWEDLTEKAFSSES